MKETGKNYEFKISAPKIHTVTHYMMSNNFMEMDANNIDIDIDVGTVGIGFLTGEYYGSGTHRSTFRGTIASKIDLYVKVHAENIGNGFMRNYYNNY